MAEKSEGGDEMGVAPCDETQATFCLEDVFSARDIRTSFTFIKGYPCSRCLSPTS